MYFKPAIILLSLAFAVMLFCVFAAPAARAAGLGNGLTEASLVTGNLTLGYLLYTPKDTSAQKPLVVYLHGNHSCGSDLKLLKDGGLPAWLSGETHTLDAFVLCPQCPAGTTWAAIASDVKALIDEVAKEYAVDVDRISITGHSLGGAGVWSMLLNYGDFFYRAAPMSGSVKAQRLDGLPHIPYWIFAGDRDIATTLESCKAAAAGLKKRGGNVKLTILKGCLHQQVPERAYAKTAVLEWLIQ